jgi:hypothetical protein
MSCDFEKIEYREKKIDRFLGTQILEIDKILKISLISKICVPQ